ncbi:MAG: PorV/PorQ family protein [Candidatus Eisenbacteria bacterium]|nr:PorV/PorQ family protein [Candidatus Eisenbacteria bacterium]
MKRCIPFYAALMFLLLSGLLPSRALAVGEAIAPSVTFAPSARSEGMGRAYVAIADDATASWWNPAGLAFLTNRNISAMHTKLAPGLADDVYYEYLGYAQSTKDWGGLAASLVYLTYGDILGTDAEGNPTGTFTSYEISPSLAYGTMLAKDLGVGVNLKIIHVNYAPSWAVMEGKAGKGTTFGADLGVLYRRNRWSLGACFQNIGPNLTLIDADQSSPISRNLKVGVAANVWEGSLGRCIAAFDVNKPFVFADDGPIVSGGGEFLFSELLAVRLGFITERWYTKDYPIEGPTFGLGLQYKGVRFDYASVPQSKELEDKVSKFSFSAKF